MQDFRQIEHDILAGARVDGHELEVLRRHLYVNGRIDRRAANFLIELHKRVPHHTPAFEHFFYQAIKDYVLADGRIGTEDAAWLRRMLFVELTSKNDARKLLHELRGEARAVSREFGKLYVECMKQPQERHNCG